jgi:4-amino-4-deoxy-L-arabinose transferase-like glycosyltransferase
MNQLFGILTISLVAGGYYFSWKYWSEEKFRLAVLLLVICGLAIRIYISTDLFLHTWDERYHALVAKHLIQHPFRPTLYDNPVLPYDYRNWTANHIWLHKQPLPLWTMAASLSLFGVHEIALRLPSSLLFFNQWSDH